MIRLRGPLEPLVDAQVSDARAARIEQAVAERLARRRGRWRWVMAAGAATALGIALFAGLEHAALPEADAPAEVAGRRLIEGAILETEAGSRLEILRSETTVLFVLPPGERLALDIPPASGRRWIVDAGPVRVEVLGTRFSVHRAADRVEVEVTRGRVQVTGGALSSPQELNAGERLEVRPLEEARSEADVPDAPAEAAPAHPRDATEGMARGVALTDAAAEAAPARNAIGIAPAPRPRAAAKPEAPVDPVAEALARADAAREAGRHQEAAATLMGILESHPGDPRGALAAFTAARIEQDILGRPARAAEALELALRGGLASELHESARARRVEALVAAGDLEEARRAAVEYLAAHPEGRLAVRARRLLELGNP